MFSIETRTESISYLEKDILLTKIKEGADIDLEEAEENLIARREITGGKKYAEIVDIRVNFRVTPEARAIGSSKESQENLIAQAILVNSLSNRLIGNFFIKFNKPHAPTKLFSSQEEALVWLRELVKKSKIEE